MITETIAPEAPAANLKDELAEADAGTQALFDEMGIQTETRERQHINLTEKVEPKAEEEEEDKKGTVKLSAELSADIIIGGVDFLQCQVLTRIHEHKFKKRMRSRYGDGAMEAADALLNKLEAERKQNTFADRTADEVGMLSLIKRYREVTDDIPFTEEEKDKVRPTLVAYLKERGGQLPPWLGLGLMVTEMIGSRIMDAVFE